LVAEINTKFHDGPVTISADGNTMYFSSDSFREKSFEKDKSNHLKLSRNNLFIATKAGENWGNIKSLPFNSKEYSTSNPSLSRDGKTLYFSSNMPGSIGGVDIWKVAVNADGTFGTPENLGANVNTEGNESFPFIADDNTTLYFASSGKQGLGGYDVYMIDLAKGTAAENMGKPINTEKDDFAFTFNKDKNTGFLSSNRNGNDDILSVTPICGVDVMVVVTNAKTGEILANAKVAILDSKNTIDALSVPCKCPTIYAGLCSFESQSLSDSANAFSNASFNTSASMFLIYFIIILKDKILISNKQPIC
jgi:Tol biopolymer transport system component